MKKWISLSTTLRSFFIFSLIIPLVIISAIALSYSRNFLIEEYKNINEQTINYLKYSVGNFIITPSKNLITMSELIGDLEDKESIDKIVRTFARQEVNFKKVIILDEMGRVEYAYPKENSSLIGFDYSLESTFVSIKNGSNEFWSDTYIDPDNKTIAIDYAVKLKGKVIVGTLLLEEFRKFAQVIKLSDDILVAVTDKSGVYIFHSDYDNVEQKITDKHVNTQSLNFEKVIIDKKEYYGSIVASNYLDWNIILYLPVNQIDSKLNQFIFVLITIIIISILLVFLIGNSITSRIIKNIKKLIRATNRVALGNYKMEHTRVNYNEFIDIMNNFEVMANEIEKRENLITMQKNDIFKLNEELEERVEERTNQLKNSNQMLESTILELNETQEQLIEREKLASLGNLVAGISHELNTPIGVILTSITYIGEECRKLKLKFESSQIKKSEFLDFLDKVSETEKIMIYNVTRTSDLITSFKLITSDNSINDFREFDVNEYIINIIKSLKPQLNKANVSVEITPTRESINLYTNPSYLYHVISNILINTVIHAYDKNGGKVILEVEDLNDRVIISVSDFGIGISNENIKKIFEPFFTTKRGLGGSGLGLNIAYNTVVKNLGGTIVCHSKLGGGTRFEITIPR